jgi:NitT/TauT family transport system permease protein
MVRKSTPIGGLNALTVSGTVEQSSETSASRLPGADWLLPGSVVVAALLIWEGVCVSHLIPAYDLPSPLAAWKALIEEARLGYLFNDCVASLFRIAIGFFMAALFGIPLGLWLGQRSTPRLALQPLVNFFRCLSPIAWIPFALSWFGIGDEPCIFLIFMASFFPLVLATLAAVAEIPAIYFRVARDYGFKGRELLTKVVFPAVLPQVITALRVTAGIAWVVVVAAEYVGCRDGLGYGIDEARNGERLDIVVAYMIVIGLLGVGIDRLIAQLTKLPNVRWGYDR